MHLHSFPSLVQLLFSFSMVLNDVNALSVLYLIIIKEEKCNENSSASWSRNGIQQKHILLSPSSSLTYQHLKTTSSSFLSLLSPVLQLGLVCASQQEHFFFQSHHPNADVDDKG